MGCLSSSEKDPENSQNKKINKKLKQVENDISNNINLLLIGPGDSGKSTIERQMRIIHCDGFSKKEIQKYKAVIYNNILDNLKILVEMIKRLNFDDLPKEIEKMTEEIFLLNGEMGFDTEIGDKIEQIWKSPSVQKAFDKRAQFHVPDTLSYYLDKIVDISEPDYQPSQDDILHCRVRTTGITQTKFTISGQNFTIVDVGGQRCERRKWINCFENITAVIFVASMSEYNQQLFEDEEMNRMHESLLLFEEITSSRWFRESSFILFLNKVDLFKKKIKKHKLKICFPKYKGKNNFEQASEYIKSKFLEKAKDQDHKIYTHFTCATDTTNVRFVFDAVKDIILQNITEFGML
ncbi:guanine nucleotide-binding protein g(o) subunit alpha [Anaeramoeba flamelloides]|uniref:Guanine nucleotide-binding protein g(O) subunit alpha n=1 Tax=Anaeramoeba flamelloides TaxID=1746091 RepID=A0AAV7Y287_9EUKA|nr:guanine nucleotide-binding protein g(o) subunit alpha [Anaeramoeba flamelloides]KAJ6229348.1 guanine nucleotide-binding protein g(o) subunit alpha [Anaeramoeba flamelloides]